MFRLGIKQRDLTAHVSIERNFTLERLVLQNRRVRPERRISIAVQMPAVQPARCQIRRHSISDFQHGQLIPIGQSFLCHLNKIGQNGDDEMIGDQEKLLDVPMECK